MKKNIFGLAKTLLLIIPISSCEKVIDVKLNSAEKKYVVEAFLTNMNTGAEVRISQTKDFDDSNNFNGISGARLALTNSLGNSYNFTETSPGIYKTPPFSGLFDVTYSLSVTVGTNLFTANSTMPLPVFLDSVFITDFSLGGQNSKNITPQYNDPVGMGNCYRFINYINGVKEKNVYVQNDDFNDGRTVTRPLINNDSQIKSGDTARIEMQCIDKPVNKYWYTLSQLQDGAGQSATPANPVSNFLGGCLGYFSVHTISVKTIIVR